MISKEEKRVLNKVYIKTQLHKIVRYPIYDTRYSFDDDIIQCLLDKNFLEVFKYHPWYNDDCSIDCIRLTDIGKDHITDNTNYYIQKRKREIEKSSKRQVHQNSIDHYNRERNPWMGNKLTRNGGKVICTECCAINKPCEHGTEFHQKLPVSARPPKATASKARWKAFKEMFIKDAK